MEAVVCISLEDQSNKFSKIHFEGWWKLQHENECRDTNLWRSQIWRFFSNQPSPPPPPPTEFANCDDLSPTSGKVIFGLWPIPLPIPLPPSLALSSNFAGKTWIYLSGASIGWIFIQSDAGLYRSNKEEGLLHLISMNNAHHIRKWSQKP